MNWIGLAAVIAAFATVLTSSATLVLAFKTRTTAVETHEIVNSQRTAMVSYNKTLTNSLRAAGIHVPEDPSIASPEDPSIVKQAQPPA